MIASNPLQPTEGALYTQVQDEIVFLTLETAGSVYFGVRGAGVRIWQLVEERQHTAEDIVQTMAGSSTPI